VELELAVEMKRAAELEWVSGRASELAPVQAVKLELAVELASGRTAELAVGLAAVRALVRAAGEQEQELASGRVAKLELERAAGARTGWALMELVSAWVGCSKRK
jgi:hypothetical protein